MIQYKLTFDVDIILLMKTCFSCLRRLKFTFSKKNKQRKWLSYVQNYCSTHHRVPWCDLLSEHYQEIGNYQNPTEEILRELRSTNISSQIIKTIRKQYRTNNTPLSLLTEIFSSYLNRKYNDTVNPTNITINKITSDFQCFLEFMRSFTVIYYQLEERELIGDDQFFKVTLSNFLSDCLFNNEQFNSCVVHVIRNSSKQAQDRVSFNMQKYQSYTIHEYGVNSKYSLDEKTLKQYNIEAKSDITRPYNGAIQLVKQVIKVRSPIDKLKCLENIILQIQFNLKRFYQAHKIECSANMDADNAIAILLYIIVQSNQSQLLSHINLVSQFVNKDILNGSSGYCLATYKACMQFLEKGNIRRCKGLTIPENQFSLYINVRSYFQQNSNQLL